MMVRPKKFEKEFEVSLVYFIFSVVVLVVVGLLTWRNEKSQGEDHELDWLAVIKNLVIFTFILVFFGKIISIVSTHLVDYWWFKELGYSQTWITRKTYEWALKMVGFFVTYLALTVIQKIAERFIPGLPERPSTPTAFYESRGYRRDYVFDQEPVVWLYYVWASRILKFLVSLVFVWLASWGIMEAMKMFNVVAWGKVDPIYNLDYSFYAVILPFLKYVLNWFFFLWFAGLVYLGAIFLFFYKRFRRFERFYENAELIKERLFAAYIGYASFFYSIYLVMTALSQFLKRYSILIDGSSKHLAGAGYVDIVAKIPGHGFATVLFFVAAVVAMVFAFMGLKYWKIFATAAIVIAVGLIAVLGIFPTIVKIKYNANPLAYEREFIENQIDGVNYAFDLGRISDQGELGFVSQMTAEDLRMNDQTLSQSRIVDWLPLLSANETLNEYLPFYNFADVDIDRYDGEEVMLSVRELNSDQIPQDGRSWVNIHFRYTHGYGYTVASVSETDMQGEPKWLVRNMPPEGPSQFMVERPEIYFGERTSDYVFVGGTYTEFGRPEGTKMREVVYEGPSGIKIGSFGRRFTLAVMLDDYRLLFSSLIDSDTKVIFNRTLDQRYKKLSPFLVCDEDPYPVLGGEEVVYIRDCYTTTDSLPYSHSYGGTRYIRGAVKMTVGAWSGETKYYVTDESDPMVQTWMDVFPDLFEPMDNLPLYLRAHLRYPDDLLRAQADAYALYHVDSADAFFNRQDQWERAKETLSVEGQPVMADPRYVMMVVPGGDKEEFVSNIFFTPIGKQNLVAGMIAPCDGDDYGKLMVYQFPRDETVVGPQMVESRISQHEDLSPMVTLWNQQGSRILWGQIIGLVLPAKEGGVSTAYVRSLYLQSQDARIPSIKLVIISQGDRLVYANSLAGALRLLYEGGGVSAVSGDEDPVRQAKEHFDAAQACAAQGDWVCFGQEMAALKNSLEAIDFEK